MSAQLIYDLAPLGTLVRFSDGTPRPPARHSKKIAAWENRNNVGRLIRKQESFRVGDRAFPASITLHQGDYSSAGTVVLRVHRTFTIDSDLRFVVTERPPDGAVLVLKNRSGDGAELVYLASSRVDAEIWLNSHGYPDASLEEVTADTIGADVMKERAA